MAQITDQQVQQLQTLTSTLATDQQANDAATAQAQQAATAAATAQAAAATAQQAQTAAAGQVAKDLAALQAFVDGLANPAPEPSPTPPAGS